MTTDNQLPLPDYDELPLASLQHQVRSLQEHELHTLVEHERAHGNRTPVLELLRARLEQLAAGATPAGGEQRTSSARPGDTASGSPVSPQKATNSTPRDDSRSPH